MVSWSKVASWIKDRKKIAPIIVCILIIIGKLDGIGTGTQFDDDTVPVARF
jgi:hypothetical protein